MAQYFWTPEPADLGFAPSNWTLRFGNTEMEVKQDIDGVYYLQLNAPSRTVSAVTIDSIDGVVLDNIGDCQIYGEYKGSRNDSSDGRQMLQLSGNETDGFIGRMSGYEKYGNAIRITTFLGMGDDNVAYTGQGTLEHYKQRSQIVGATHKVSVWDAALTEPANWMLEHTHTAVAPVGRLGQYRWEDGVVKVYCIGIGTNGDPAPTEKPTYTIADFFSDVDGTFLQNHTALTGESWVKHPSRTADLTIQNNKLDVSADSTYYLNSVMPSMNYSVSANVAQGASQVANRNALCVQMSPTADTFYYIDYEWGGAGLWILRRRINGSDTELATYSYTGMDTDVPLNVKLEVDGDTKRVYLEGALIITHTDTDANKITTPGYVGIYSAGFGDPAIDNFMVHVAANDGGTETKNFTFTADSIADAIAQSSKTGVSSFDAIVAASGSAGIAKTATVSFDAQALSSASFVNQKLSPFTFATSAEANATVTAKKVSTYAFDAGILADTNVSYEKAGLHSFGALAYADAWADIEKINNDVRLFTFGAQTTATSESAFTKVGVVSFSGLSFAGSTAAVNKVSTVSFTTGLTLEAEASFIKVGQTSFDADLKINSKNAELLKAGNYSFSAEAWISSTAFAANYQPPKTLLETVNGVSQNTVTVTAVNRVDFNSIDL